MKKYLATASFLFFLLPNSASAWESDNCPDKPNKSGIDWTEPACQDVPKPSPGTDQSAVTIPPALPRQFPNLTTGKIVFAFGSDGDGCLASSPVAYNYTTNKLIGNPGIRIGGHRNGHCAYKDQLSRAKVVVNEFEGKIGSDRYTARIFSVYAVKDQSTVGSFIPIHKWEGHTHDWEDVVIWMKNGVIQSIGSSQHGPIHNYSVNDVPSLKSNPKAYAFKYVVHKGTHNFSKADGTKKDNQFIPKNTDPTPIGPNIWFGEDESIYLDYRDRSTDGAIQYWDAIETATFGTATFKAGNANYINQNKPSNWPTSLELAQTAFVNKSQ